MEIPTGRRSNSSGACRFYVDHTYLMLGPWQTDGDPSSVEGVWTRSYEIYRPDAGGNLQPFANVEETLEFGADGAWTWQRVDTLVEGGTEETTESGTFTLEVSDGYVENYGNYLFVDITARDGARLDPAEEEVWLQRSRLDKMLLNPWVRATE